MQRELATVVSINTCQLNIWTMGFIVSPFLSPFMMGFIVARIEYVEFFPVGEGACADRYAHSSWRWTYGIGSIYSAIVVALIAFFGEET